MPVSEVGDAVIGRGFGLMHDPGRRGRRRHRGAPVDAGQPGVRLVRAVLGGAGPRRRHDGAARVSVAEVVSPTEPESAPLARELMVALVRAGVTATCSSADRPRYGDLDVDSNLPDARIALGGPDQNAFTAAVLAEADPVYTEELKRQLYASGAARVWVPRRCPAGGAMGARRGPARRARAAGARSSPGTDLDAAVAAVVEDLADAEIVGRPGGAVGAASPSKPAPSRCSTAACPASRSSPTARCTRR